MPGDKNDDGALRPGKAPCGTCPYRQDVPSGVWAETEYVKLPEYDLPMHMQPPGVFMCHQQDGRLCSGWLGCHGAENLMSVRLAAFFDKVDIPATFEFKSPVPLFGSGAEAAIHGMEDIDDPSEDALFAIEKLMIKRGEAPDEDID
jgi:hypothetical protein